ncbi:hypothetical protein OHW57_13420 [Acinetobacter baumannii]|nr:hypothetical protein [Acinetobacter baumannii]
MRKIYIYIFFLVIILLSFLAISYFVQTKIKVNGDYLSAFATLLATFVAMNLFKDWQDKYKSRLLERLKNKLINLFNDLEIRLEFYVFELDRVENTEIKLRAKVFSREAKIILQELNYEIDYYDELLTKFKVNKNNLNISNMKDSLILVENFLNFDKDRRSYENNINDRMLKDVIIQIESSKKEFVKSIQSIILLYL